MFVWFFGFFGFPLNNAKHDKDRMTLKSKSTSRLSKVELEFCVHFVGMNVRKGPINTIWRKDKKLQDHQSRRCWSGCIIFLNTKRLSANNGHEATKLLWFEYLLKAQSGSEVTHSIWATWSNPFPTGILPLSWLWLKFLE